MHSFKRLILVVPALALAAGLHLHGQESGAAKGTVLVLQNERTLEVDIAKVGEQYVIRRGNAEVTIQGNQVLKLCGDWEEALHFMKARAQLGDPDERLRLARWCHVNNLLEEALVEAQAALEIRPN